MTWKAHKPAVRCQHTLSVSDRAVRRPTTKRLGPGLRTPMYPYTSSPKRKLWQIMKPCPAHSDAHERRYSRLNEGRAHPGFLEDLRPIIPAEESNDIRMTMWEATKPIAAILYPFTASQSRPRSGDSWLGSISIRCGSMSSRQLSTTGILEAVH